MKIYIVTYVYKTMADNYDWRLSTMQIDADSIDECLQDAKNLIGSLYKYYEITDIEGKF